MWGYYAVGTANRQAGIVAVAPNTHPASVNGSAVTSSAYLGDESTPQNTMLSYLNSWAGSFAPGLFEQPGGTGQFLSAALGNFNYGAQTGGSSQVIAWNRNVPGNATWDLDPTILVGILAGVVAAPVIAGAGGAAAEGTGAGAAAEGAGAGAAAGSAATGVLKSVASKVAGAAGSDATKALTAAGLIALVTDLGLWKGILIIAGGAFLLVIAARQLGSL